MTDPSTYIDPRLLPADLLVLQNLLQDIDRVKSEVRVKPTLPSAEDSGYSSLSSSNVSLNETAKTAARGETNDVQPISNEDEAIIAQIKSWNDTDHEKFEPTVVSTWDVKNFKTSPFIDHWILQPYIRWARTVVRNETDVVMLTHLILYFTTTVPSAILLYCRFHWIHGVLHAAMQFSYAGSYTLMMHQHIHQGGILTKRYPYALFDRIFPYLTDPLMGHTWNSYYFHHVKHHHVEGNGPSDLSSTIRYQRDSLPHFLHYFLRFLLLVWADLPLYFIRKHKPSLALKTLLSELSSYAYLTLLTTLHPRATLFVHLIPLLTMRTGLMVGNWGQHAFVDEADPDSDFRSSITLLDVASNRFCFNDGYHTSHHLNPRRHWRDHPLSFLRQKHTYAAEGALVFRNIDYLMITVRLLCKDYKYLAKCLVPIGEVQIGMNLEERAAMLESKTRRFDEEEIRRKFPRQKVAGLQRGSTAGREVK